MDMLSPLVELDAVDELIEEHFSGLHAQLRTGATTKVLTCLPKHPQTPVKAKVAPQSKKRRRQQPDNIATGRWNKYEHDLFLRGLATYGKEWKKIAGLISSRTVVQIRTHAQKYFQKIKKRKARGKSIDSVTDITQVRHELAVKKKRSARCKAPSLPVLAPIIQAEKKVKTKRSYVTKKPNAQVHTTAAPMTPGPKEPCRDGSPMSHFDLMFHFPAQSGPESATNLFPTVFSADLGFDDMILGEIPTELRSLEDMTPDKTGWPAHHELLSLEDWNDDFPDFNCSFASGDIQYPLSQF